jgi:hypothetical protein
MEMSACAQAPPAVAGQTSRHAMKKKKVDHIALALVLLLPLVNLWVHVLLVHVLLLHVLLCRTWVCTAATREREGIEEHSLSHSHSALHYQPLDL